LKVDFDKYQLIFKLNFNAKISQKPASQI